MLLQNRSSCAISMLSTCAFDAFCSFNGKWRCCQHWDVKVGNSSTIIHGWAWIFGTESSSWCQLLHPVRNVTRSSSARKENLMLRDVVVSLQSKVGPFTVVCWPMKRSEGGPVITFALPPCVCFVNDLLCEWHVAHSHTELGGLCDALMRHIKRDSIEICSGGKGCHHERSTSRNNTTGGPS